MAAPQTKGFLQMESFVAVVHILVALVLIALVLVQDSKSGSLGGAFGGGGSNSVFGATGATTLAQKMTRYTAVVFAITCIALSVFSSRSNKSILETMPISPSTAPAAPTTAAPETSAPAADQKAPAAPAESKPAEQTK